MERSNRTVREALEEAEPGSRYEAEAALGQIIHWYNHERLHSSLGYLRPVDYYRGNRSRCTRPGEGSWPPRGSPAREEPGTTTTNLAHCRVTNLLQTSDLEMSHCR